ncbi:uncharacterized protein ARMOST_11694 [Armillaria ostoyae]|uniref:Peptidase A2 domain-containing protein n=1 Tax=Armillaria ostoyae TaxID=47428 RepID=A0A284RHV6_ARMOS|nr:uncharacterized protein ARMOST_11694 [Armillaria ostoyae]
MPSSTQTSKESHNRYAILADSSMFPDDEESTETESLIKLGDSALRQQVASGKPNTPMEVLNPQEAIEAQKANRRDLLIPVQLETLDSHVMLKASTLVDSGCTSSSIHQLYIEAHGLNIQLTASPIPIYNADGSHNKVGEITAYTELHLKIGDHSERIDLAVTDLGSKKIFLGHDWLICHNPVINWKTGKITFAHC